MINFNKKSAFSLAESIVSMLLLVLVVMLTLSSITRKKTNFSNKSTISGMYACWNDGNLKQMRYSGNVCIDDNNNFCSKNDNFIVTKCQFKMDRRVSKYNIIAVGSRKNGINGQLKQAIITTPSGEDEDEMVITMELGGGSNGGITKVIQDNDVKAQALGGIKSENNKLVPGNIKRCKYISGGRCDSGEYSKCEKTVSESNYASSSNPYKTNFIINCVDKETELANNNHTCQLVLSELTLSSGIYTGKCAEDSSKSARIKIEEEDSSLKAKGDELINSQFVRYLKMIPPIMQNGLTDTLLNYYQSGNDKNGVVLIIW